jgi:hypothetical protein
MPATIKGQPTHEKSIVPGDLIVMAGGRIGKDGHSRRHLLLRGAQRKFPGYCRADR